MDHTAWMSVFFILTAIGSALVHYHFVSSSWKHIPIFTHVLLVFSIFTCISPFPLLVLDVDAALSTPITTPPQTQSSFHPTALPWWLFLFIASQVMAWIALPIAQAYDVGGEFNAWERFKGAIRVNVKMYIVLGILVGALLGYVMFLKNVSSFLDVLHVTIAAANAFGLFLLVVFLACGLLGIPRRLWRMSDPETLLEEEYRRARRLHDELDVAKTDVVLLRAEALAVLSKFSNGGAPHVVAVSVGEETQEQPAAAAASSSTADNNDDKKNVQGILDSIAEFEKEVHLHQHGTQRPDDRKNRTLVELNEDIMSAIKVCRRLDFQWHECVAICIQLSNVVAGHNSSLYWKTVRKPLMRVGCAVSIILTGMVLFSELVVPFQSLKNARQISIVEVLLQYEGTRFVAAIVFLGYMGISGYWAIFQFHVFDLFVVVPRISDAASLCFVVTFLTRLVLPLCYNFLWIADLTNKNHGGGSSSQPQLVVYSEVFGKMDVVDFLGKWFNQFMPVFIPVLAILIEAKVIHRFLQWVGVEGFETGEESEVVRRQAVEEGRAIVAREANRELHSVKMVPSSGSVDSSSPAAAAASPDGSPGVTPRVGGGEMTNDERKRRYETWKMSHGGGAAATIPINVE